MLGRTQIKRWVQLTLFASGDSHATENPLVDMAAVRGGLMEQMAMVCPGLHNNRDAAEQAYMIGILSLLESLYDISMEQISLELNLPKDVQQALLSREGNFGALLNLVESVEQVNFSVSVEILEELSIPYHLLMEGQIKAYNWYGPAEA